MSKEAILKKIKKCLELSKSANPNEAAAALIKAQQLMEQYQVSDEEIRLSDITEEACTTARAHNPPLWMTHLDNVVCNAYGVECFYNQTFRSTECVFVGLETACKTAAYTYTVLRRKLTRDRQTYYKSLRGKKINKSRRADWFCLAWVGQVGQKVRTFAGKPENLILEYCKKHYPDLVEFKNPVKGKADKHYKDIMAGAKAADNVELHHGVDGEAQKQIGGFCG